MHIDQNDIIFISIKVHIAQNGMIFESIQMCSNIEANFFRPMISHIRGLSVNLSFSGGHLLSPFFSIF